VPQSVVMDIIGHESRAVSQVYTHVGDAEKRQAMAALPSRSALLRAADSQESKRTKKRAQSSRKTNRGNNADFIPSAPFRSSIVQKLKDGGVKNRDFPPKIARF
jgi:hypothetical protein